MAKFRVTTTRVKTENYSTTDTEADTAEEAQSMVEEMINDEELSLDSEDISFEHKVEEIDEDAKG